MIHPLLALLVAAHMEPQPPSRQQPPDEAVERELLAILIPSDLPEDSHSLQRLITKMDADADRISRYLDREGIPRARVNALVFHQGALADVRQTACQKLTGRQRAQKPAMYPRQPPPILTGPKAEDCETCGAKPGQECNQRTLGRRLYHMARVLRTKSR